MATSQSSSAAKVDQVDADLMTMQEEYIENAPGVNLTKMGVINHMDTWRVNPNHILLQHMTPEVSKKGNSLAHSKRDVMIN